MTHSSLLPALSVNIETPSLAGSAGGYLVFDDATYGKFDTGTFAPLGGYQKDQVAKTRQVNIKRGDSSPTDVMFHAQTGTASVTLDNRTRTFDPVSNSDVRPMRGINITAAWGSGISLSMDSFNRANGSLGSTDGSGTKDPAAWNVISITGGTSGITIVSNQAKSGSGGATRTAATLDLATADVSIQCVPASAGVQAGVVGRCSDGNNFWALRIDTSSGSKWVLEKWTSGSSSTPITLSNNGASNGDTGILIMTGTTITAQKLTSGGSLVTMGTGTNSFNSTVTTHGILCWEALAPVDNWAASATSNNTYDLFTGFVTDWNETYPASGKDAVTSAQCADGSYLLVNANVADTFPVESTGARVNELLDLAEWPQVLRAVEAGSIQMHASIPTGSAWSAMQEAADSEMGDLYVAADGTMTFRASTSLVSDSRSTTSQATFGDAGAELPYSDVVLSYDTKRIHNTVSVSYNEAGDVVYQSDAVSLNAYGPSAFNVQAAIADKTSAQHLADFIINLYSQPLIRVDSLVLKPARSPSTLWPQALGLEIGDRITVKLTPPGGGSRVSRDGWVRGIEHQITADGDWTTTFTLQDVSNLASYIIFDTSVFDGTDQFWF